MSLSVNQSPAATTPDEAAKLISNAAQGAKVQRDAVVQQVAANGAKHQAKSGALLDILEKSTFVEEGSRAFLGNLIDGQVADISGQSAEGQTAIRQTNGGLTRYMLEQSAPHDPTTAPYVVSAEIAGGLPGAFLAAKAGLEATVDRTAAPKKRIPDANVPSGGKPFPPPSQPAPSKPAPVETAPAPTEAAAEKAAPASAEGAPAQQAAAPEGTHEAQPAAQSAEVVKVAEGGKSPERKEEPRQA